MSDGNSMKPRGDVPPAERKAGVDSSDRQTAPNSKPTSEEASIHGENGMSSSRGDTPADTTAPPAVTPPSAPDGAAPPLVEEAKEAKRPVSDAVSVDAIRAMLSSEMGGLRTALGQQVEKVAEEVDAAKRQVSLLPNTIRSLERKVMDLHSSLSESRYKALLEQILRIYDMVDQVSRGVSNVPGCTALNETRRNYEVLKTQILQILKMNGLSEIPASGAVDFGLHQVMGKVPCKDRSVDGTIARVTRPGFRNDVGNTLRFAEVYVYGYEEPKQPECAGVAAPVSESAAACNRQ